MRIQDMLRKDQDTFERVHPEAVIFLRAAGLRYEAHCLMTQQNRTPWEYSRLGQLLKDPACRDLASERYFNNWDWEV